MVYLLRNTKLIKTFFCPLSVYLTKLDRLFFHKFDLFHLFDISSIVMHRVNEIRVSIQLKKKKIIDAGKIPVRKDISIIIF